MNLVIVTGRFVRDPIMCSSKKSGRVFMSMRFCIEGNFRGRNVDREADFVDVLAFGTKGRDYYNKWRKGMRVILWASLSVYEDKDKYGNRRERVCLIAKSYEPMEFRDFKEPIRDLNDSSGNLLIPKEITDSLIRQVDTDDEDIPVAYAERVLDDSFQD